MTNYSAHMTNRVLGSYLKTHRKRSGLSQQEMGRLLGYKNQWQVSRHERSQTVPPLLIALAYEAIFQVPVATLFTGMYATIAHVIEGNIATLEKELLSRRSSAELLPASHAQKLKWLSDRKALK